MFLIAFIEVALMTQPVNFNEQKARVNARDKV